MGSKCTENAFAPGSPQTPSWIRLLRGREWKGTGRKGKRGKEGRESKKTEGGDGREREEGEGKEGREAGVVVLRED